MKTLACFALTIFIACAAWPAPALAADMALMPINLKGDPPGPFSEVYETLLWEAIYFRLDTHIGVNITNYNRASRALDDANLAPGDLTAKTPFVKVHNELDTTAYIAVHLTIKAPKPPKKKTAKPKPYIYGLTVFMYNSESGYLIKVLKTTIKPKRVASITGMAALIEKKIADEGRLNPKLQEKPKVAETDESFSKFYVDHAKKSDDRDVKERCYRKAVHLTPDDRKLWMEFIEMLVKAKDAKATFTTFLEAEEMFPGDADLCAYHAEVALKLGDRDEAETALKKALEINPDNMHALLLKANMLFSDGDYAGAKEIYEKLAGTVTLEEMRKEMVKHIEDCEKKIKEAEKEKKEKK